MKMIIKKIYWPRGAKYLVRSFTFLSGFILMTGLATPTWAVNMDCRAIIDAGSSGTRLHVLEKKGDTWIEYVGGKTGALADPVRGNRGKVWQDADKIVADISALLAPTKSQKLSNKSGLSSKRGVGWQNQCTPGSISVYATAGMRIAEQENPDLSAKLWLKLKEALKTRYPDATIQARTLSGFEEGLFMWLTLYQHAKNKHHKSGNEGRDKGSDFGVVEVGGASAQVTFPCADCSDAQEVKVDNTVLHMFSYSFLGLGANEAVKTMGAKSLKNPACALSAGKDNPSWKVKACSDTIPLRKKNGIADPYNFDPKARETFTIDTFGIGHHGKGTFKAIPPQAKNIKIWYLAGTLAYYTDKDVHKYCVRGEPAFKANQACFRAVYNQKLLHLVGVKKHKSTAASAALGAAICEDANCLALMPQQECTWMKDGCLPS